MFKKFNEVVSQGYPAFNLSDKRKIRDDRYPDKRVPTLENY